MKNIALVLCSVIPLFGAAAASAQEDIPARSCTTHEDCPEGESCQRSACPTCDPSNPDCVPAECPGYCAAEAAPPATECSTDADCGPDETCTLVDSCRPCDTTVDPNCQSGDCAGAGGFCSPRPAPACTTDADCSNGDVCILESSESCASSGCACPSDGDEDPNNDPPCECDPAEPPVCTTETFAFCGPRYLDDCTVDADCGPGFACEVAAACPCTIDSDGNETCDCPASTEASCVLVRVECTDDTDCADGLTCVEEAASAPCLVDENGNSSCEPEATTRICAPPDYAGEPVRDEVSGTPNEEPSDAGDADGADDGDGDGEEYQHEFDVACSQGSAAGLSPFAGLALLLLRRRRR